MMSLSEPHIYPSWINMSYSFFGPTSENGGNGATFNGDKDLDLKGHRVTNMGDPISEGNAVNLKYVTKELGATKKGPKGDKGDTGPADRRGVKGDQGDRGDHKVQKGILVREVPMVIQVPRVLPVLKDQRVTMVSQEVKDFVVIQVHKARVGYKVQKVIRETKGTKVIREIQVVVEVLRKVQKGTKVIRETRETLVCKVQKG